jgi:DNA-binding LacI/PurR family transcriptional regulator
VLPSVIWERGSIDGLIVAGTNYPNFLTAVRRLDMPFVVLGNNVVGEFDFTGIKSVWFDTRGGCREATNYLIKLGHHLFRG